ncbi:ABC transporter substrate-binding protein [Ruania alkalisoli]|uniref:ABC transporter substrate-binding protein n=1 Tax=Ruania alkalisoli TaxID=2779775 RepID=A0A7M1SSX6_9MICO|nr:ABC transporter substrate-binding protein [Ruania alkalisoli]QOR70666.1 ABC transporter substrate-binding protein [Ruania alkalisoli]
MMQTRPSTLPRRQFLAWGGGTMATAIALGGCDMLDDTDPGTTEPTGAKGREAPDLAAQVEAGELPPVEERLPSTPLVVEPNDEVGRYGGAWRTAVLKQANASAWVEDTIGYEHLVRFLPNTTDLTAAGVTANVAESFEYNDEGTEYTFRLRNGMRWSDGEPFTADDIMFWYEAVFLNEDLTPAKANWLTSAGAPVTVQKVDEQTVTFIFDEPNGLFLAKLAQEGDLITRVPKHYLQQFHPDFAEDIDSTISDAGLSTWVELFEAKGGTFTTRFNNAELPTLCGWSLDHGVNEDVQELVARRNPYYWKVDPDGSQLPYLDEVRYAVVSETETLVLNAVNGEIDFHFPNIGDAANRPLLADNQESADYHFVTTVKSHSTVPVIHLNLSHQDPVKREIFNNKDFRIGLSHAIDRQTIIDAVYARQGEPFQAAPRPESDFYDEEMATQYTEFDLDLANEHLDRAGYSETNSDGMRLGPDGNPISFDVEVASQRGPDVDTMELVRQQWLAVGIEVSVSPEDMSLFLERQAGNHHDAAVHFAVGGLNALLHPSLYFPYDTFSRYAVPWAQWYASRGESGQEPPEAVRRQMDLYDQITTTASADDQNALMQEILAIAKEEFYTIGVTLWEGGVGIVKNDFHNVPAELTTGAYSNPATTNPCQYFRS